MSCQASAPDPLKQPWGFKHFLTRESAWKQSVYLKGQRLSPRSKMNRQHKHPTAAVPRPRLMEGGRSVPISVLMNDLLPAVFWLLLEISVQDTYTQTKKKSILVTEKTLLLSLDLANQYSRLLVACKKKADRIAGRSFFLVFFSFHGQTTGPNSHKRVSSWQTRSEKMKLRTVFV